MFESRFLVGHLFVREVDFFDETHFWREIPGFGWRFPLAAGALRVQKIVVWCLVGVVHYYYLDLSRCQCWGFVVPLLAGHSGECCAGRRT